ncbi:MAG: 1,4-dihydroxy-2-naphthoate polyprenyltransferase, partial [Anaerolineales bacterium]|nr:1,4-dihydroxy-2-naphthoate polyprenyltransferase [Anaerolineales bacterium]
FMWLTGNASPWVLLTWLTLYRAIPLIKMIYTEKGKVLNKALGGTGRMELEFALLLAVGLMIG